MTLASRKHTIIFLAGFVILYLSTHYRNLKTFLHNDCFACIEYCKCHKKLFLHFFSQNKCLRLHETDQTYFTLHVMQIAHTS